MSIRKHNLKLNRLNSNHWTTWLRRTRIYTWQCSLCDDQIISCQQSVVILGGKTHFELSLFSPYCSFMTEFTVYWLCFVYICEQTLYKKEFKSADLIVRTEMLTPSSIIHNIFNQKADSFEAVFFQLAAYDFEHYSSLQALANYDELFFFLCFLTH